MHLLIYVTNLNSLISFEKENAPRMSLLQDPKREKAPISVVELPHSFAQNVKSNLTIDS